MPITTRCPNCRLKYQVREESLGSRATCKKCGQTFTVEMTADETVGVQPSADAETPPQQLDFFESRRQQPKERPPDQSLDAARPVPEKIGPYTVRRPLGGGAMGEVWLAWDPALQRDVAIKTLRREIALNPQGLDRFLREARSAAKLHHTNAVTVYQVGVEGTTPYIAMEYVEGQSLDTVVGPGRPLEWREATRVIRDAAAGLAAAHELGLIHRDIKPANLMRTTAGVTKVVDFGLARAQASQTQITHQGSILGTPAYLAPEVWGRQEPDARSDLYALACTYFCLLTGEPPFEADNPVALGYQHTHEPLPDPRLWVPGLPNTVCHILAKGTNKEPAERYQTAAEMLEDLDALLGAPQGPPALERAEDVTPPPIQSVGAVTFRWPALRAAAARMQAVARRFGGGILDKRPKWVLWTTWTAAALVVLTFFVLSLPARQGRITIELSDPTAAVQVLLDGAPIDTAELSKPLLLTAGAHQLTVSGEDFETVRRSFIVSRGGDESLHVALVLQRPPPPEVPPAVIAVDLTPADASLDVIGENATIAGHGGRRTVTVARPYGQRTIMLVAKKTGYESQQQELQPAPGTTQELTLSLQPLPPPAEPPPEEKPSKPEAIVITVDVEPADALLTVSGKGATVSNEGGRWTVTVAQPDGQRTIVLLATKTGYEPQQQALQPNAGGSQNLTLRLQPIPAPPASKPSPTIVNSIGMKLNLIQAGEFWMGSPDSEGNRRSDEGPRHWVRITKSFYLGVYEVTQGEYEEAMGTNPSNFKSVTGQEPSRFPVETVSWQDAVDFCRKLSQLTEERQTGRVYRLPTEAEWEYACRGGTATQFHFGSSLSVAQANVRGGDGGTWPLCTTAVGSYQPNDWGLHDMHGNVYEWCADWYDKDYYASSPTDNPMGPASGSFRVGRGGCWGAEAAECRSAGRRYWGTTGGLVCLGFRVAVDLDSSRGTSAPHGSPGLTEKQPQVKTATVSAGVNASSATLSFSWPAAERVNASLWIDGVLRPLPNDTGTVVRVTVTPGTHHVRIRRGLFEPIELAGVVLADGETREVALRWEPWPCIPPTPAVSPFDAGQAKKHQQEWAAYLGVDLEITNSIGMKLVLIPPGEFLIGTDAERMKHLLSRYYRAADLIDETPQYLARINQAFYLGVYEVTQGEYKRVMGMNPSRFLSNPSGDDAVSDSDRRPVENVSWEATGQFCQKLSQFAAEESAFRRYGLPREPEWEYACRAGTTGDFSFDEATAPLADYAWFADSSGQQTHPVGLLKPNAWGLYDMHGNVWERCDDRYIQYKNARPNSDRTSYNHFVRRGGSWSDPDWYCRSAKRAHTNRDTTYSVVGFRVACRVPAARVVRAAPSTPTNTDPFGASAPVAPATPAAPDPFGAAAPAVPATPAAPDPFGVDPFGAPPPAAPITPAAPDPFGAAAPAVPATPAAADPFGAPPP